MTEVDEIRVQKTWSLPSSTEGGIRHRLGTLNSVLRSFLRRGKVTRDRISMSAVMEDDENVSENAINSPEETRVAVPVMQPQKSKAEIWISATAAELEKAFKIATDTALRMPASAKVDKGEVESYINKVFDLQVATRQKIWQDAKDEMRKHLQLQCMLIGASDLPGVDANGNSDPYCVLGIFQLSDMDLQSATVSKNNLGDWHSETIVKNIVQSSTKPATQQPQWNERYEFTVQDPTNEVLVIEVWDSKETPVPMSEIRGIKGLGIFIKDFRKADKFIGRTFYHLKNIPLQGEFKSLDLYSHTTNHRRGKLSVHFTLRTDDVDKRIGEKVKDHKVLLRGIVSQESKEASRRNGWEGYQVWWDAKLGLIAETLLLAHASFCGLEPIHQLSCRLSVLYEYHRAFRIQPAHLTTLLNQIVKNTTGLPQSNNDRNGDSSANEWSYQFLNNLQSIVVESMAIMDDHLALFNTKAMEDIEYLKGLLHMIKKLYEYGDLVSQLPTDLQSPQSRLEHAIQESILNTYLPISRPITASESKGDFGATLAAVKYVATHALHQCQMLHKTIAPLFQQLFGVDYMTHFLQSLDKLLPPLVTNMFGFSSDGHTEHEQKLLSASLEIYLVFQELSKIAKASNPMMCGDLQFLSYQSWFVAIVSGWLKMALIDCKEKIEKAIQAEKAISATGEVSFSSSAIDTVELLHYLVVFWKHLEWSNPEETYGFTVIVVKYVTEAALYYVELIHRRLSTEKFLDKETGKFSFTDELCIILNNIQHVQSKISLLNISGECSSGIINELQLEILFDRLEREKGIGQLARTVITDVMHSAAEDIQHKIFDVIDLLGEQFLPTISEFIEELTKVKEGRDLAEAIAPLKHYLSVNVNNLNAKLLYNVFMLLLQKIWALTIRKISSCVSRLQKQAPDCQIYRLLYGTLLALRDFLFARGEGLTGECLETDEYKLLFEELDIIHLSTNGLMLRCCIDLSQQQAKALLSSVNKFGTLFLSTAYLQSEAELEVTLHYGKDLPALDKNGLCDPFVEITFLPENAFPAGKKILKTRVQKRTRNPIFNEEFRFPITRKQLHSEGTVMVLSAYNYDKIGRNELMGISVVQSTLSCHCSRSKSLDHFKSSIFDIRMVILKPQTFLSC
ncbi:hypothetical protein EMCRGX_G027677 [Ephydatia muelleri]